MINKIEKIAKKYFINASGCHDWTHVERVRNLALHIGRKENADLGVIEIAALLHDIGRKEEMEKKGLICHAEVGGVESKKILKKLGFENSFIDKVTHVIETHRFRKGKQPLTIEAKCVFDADKLDSIGAMGVARTFLFAGNAGSGTMYTGNEEKVVKEGIDRSYSHEDSGYLEYLVKLRYIKDKVLTKEGKKIAQGRHKFMKAYFDRFWVEVEGKK